jgi:FKBP-type peptidyl-prolyl cis-trans isomerase (trigger factor)
MDDLMSKINSVASNILESERLQKLTEAIVNNLIASNPIDIPQFMLTAEAKYAAAFHKRKLEDLQEEMIKQLYAQADKNLRVSFILDAIRNAEPDAVLNDAEAIEKIKNFAIARGQNPDDILKSQALPQLISTIKDEFTIQWVLLNSTIVQ